MRKKFIFISLMVFAIFAVSCTQDTADGDGIFEQVVSQSASSKYRIKQYLGNIEGNYYYIEEHGLYRNGSILKSGNFSNGYFNPATKEIFLLSNADAKIYKYAVETSQYSQYVPADSELKSCTFNQITDSGFAVASKKAANSEVEIKGIIDLTKDSKINNSTTWTDLLNHYGCILSSRNSILIEKYSISGEVQGNTYYLYTRQDPTLKLVKGMTGMIIAGFQEIDKNNFYAVYTRNGSSPYNYVYKITTSGASSSITNAISRIATSNYLLKDGYQCASFYDSTGANGGLVGFRSASRYEMLKNLSTKPSYYETYGGFAAGIYTSDMELMNVLPKLDSSGKPINGSFIFAFYKYGLFEVKPSSNITTQIKFQ